MRTRRMGLTRGRSPLEAEPIAGSLVTTRPGRAPAASRLPARAIGRLPLVAALVPDPDVWRIAGVGRTLVARRRPNGRIAWASLAFDLKRPDDMRLFGNLDAEEHAFEEILDALYRVDGAASMVGGTDSLASRFTRGALAYARQVGGDPAPEPELLAVFDRGQSPESGALDAFTGALGLCLPDMLDACREEAAAGLPPGQSLATQVCLGFRVASSERFLAHAARDPDFVATSKSSFAWQPRALGAARLGSVHWFAGHAPSGQPDELEAESVSLDLAARLCTRIKQLADGAVSLVALARAPIQ